MSSAARLAAHRKLQRERGHGAHSSTHTALTKNSFNSPPTAATSASLKSASPTAEWGKKYKLK